MIIVVDL